MSPEELTESLKREANRLGFQLTGACAAVRPQGFDHFESWLDAGYHGEMKYLDERKEAYKHPKSVLDGAVSVLMLGMNYQTKTAAPTGIGQGRVSRYAWGNSDYHDLIHSKLKTLVRFSENLPVDLKSRGVIDTAPLLEREFAQLCGMGWQAKNTMLINRQIGSWFFLAALLLDVELAYDIPFETSHCGTCTACLDACPTDAFVKAGVLDATKCISYLTIEHRSPIPMELREQLGQWAFGCDVCQDVCPWNNKAVETEEDNFQPNSNRNPLDLLPLFFLDDDQFRAMFRKTPLWRPKRRGIVRNAATVLGNNPNDGNVPALEAGLNDEEDLIRGASAWALGRHSIRLAEPILNARLENEASSGVVGEIEAALVQLTNNQEH